MMLRGRVKRLERDFGDAFVCPVCNGEPPWFSASYHYGEPKPQPTPDQCCPKCGKYRPMLICYKEETAIQARSGSYTAAELRERMSMT